MASIKKCPHCSKTFKDKSGLNCHLITHDADAAVKCEVCRKPYKNRLVLNVHFRMQHGPYKKIYRCKICHKEFSTSQSIKKHMAAMHSTKPRPRLPCTFSGCDKSFLNKDDVTQHFKMNHTENPRRFRCTLCDKKFKYPRDLNEHLMYHTKEKAYKCATCGKGFPKKSKLARHELTHLERSSRKLHKCPLCQKEFSLVENLRAHTKNIHNTATERPRFPCTSGTCDRTFLTKGTLAKHFEVEHSENPVRFPCTYCEKEFKTWPELDLHILTHTKEKPYKCATCKKSFAQKNKLHRHQETHREISSRKFFQCESCPRQFLSMRGRRLHSERDHERRPAIPAKKVNKKVRHSCDRCAYKSHIKAQLTVHFKRVHGGVRKNECYFCGKKFFSFSELVRHCGKVHTMEK
ncbi:zinc finger protein 227 [Folsomia candida]|uniref:Zinc finger protein 58 n=1 Tax=Folsomia candida TaxID=158441 RepID=A0A226DP02_FOLCA|nr:zinc finger protein 227 [Folsomia candida]XP_035713128.1 zinc finger protein 227 [Folsomia candida]OXA45956.1 Zinc finger protein 58 [Folsomia candida]